MENSINSSGFISYLAYTDTMASEYTTTTENETILFLDKLQNNAQRYLNSLLVENTGSSTLYLRVLPSNYVLVVPVGESRTYDYTETNGVQVIGASGSTLRWCGCFY